MERLEKYSDYQREMFEAELEGLQKEEEAEQTLPKAKKKILLN